jgi:hypothetical protein
MQYLIDFEKTFGPYVQSIFENPGKTAERLKLALPALHEVLSVQSRAEAWMDEFVLNHVDRCKQQLAAELDGGPAAEDAATDSLSMTVQLETLGSMSTSGAEALLKLLEQLTPLRKSFSDHAKTLEAKQKKMWLDARAVELEQYTSAIETLRDCREVAHLAEHGLRQCLMQVADTRQARQLWASEDDQRMAAAEAARMQQWSVEVLQQVDAAGELPSMWASLAGSDDESLEPAAPTVKRARDDAAAPAAMRMPDDAAAPAAAPAPAHRDDDAHLLDGLDGDDEDVATIEPAQKKQHTAATAAAAAAVNAAAAAAAATKNLAAAAAASCRYFELDEDLWE